MPAGRAVEPDGEGPHLPVYLVPSESLLGQVGDEFVRFPGPVGHVLRYHLTMEVDDLLACEAWLLGLMQLLAGEELLAEDTQLELVVVIFHQCAEFLREEFRSKFVLLVSQ